MVSSNFNNGLIFNFLLFFAVSLFPACGPVSEEEAFRSADHYLNLNDTVAYTGMNSCRECHYQNYLGFLSTGMGQSFDSANKRKSSAVLGKDSILYDRYNNLYYHPFWEGVTLKLREYRNENGIITHERIETVNYIVGSGHHTNSHIYLSGQYAYQVPFTYYTQDGILDFPPGFEDGYNSRFSRKIGLECMSCHNGYPEFVMGSENKYKAIPDGIDCERCHGPGELHVKMMRKSILIDTSKYIDYSIVNPVKLDPERRIDVCARCHLQGTMVLKPGQNFYSFKPGMKLSDVMDIFMPLFEGGKEDFIMASHYERLTQSRCSVESNHGFDCIDCHNPHLPLNKVPDSKYNCVCNSCHTDDKKGCSAQMAERLTVDDNCVNCHMRNSGSRDIPHVRIHDHKISKPPTPEQLNSEKVFKGLVAVNDPHADSLMIARGYIKEYETYHADPAYLDSAFIYLQAKKGENEKYHFNALVNYYFLKKDHRAIISMVEAQGITSVLDNMVNQQDYSNYDAWTSYRIGQAFENGENQLVAEYFYRKATNLEKFNLEFQNKLGAIHVMRGEYLEARKVYDFIIREDSRYVPALVNQGFVLMHLNDYRNAEVITQKALLLDPDNLEALFNLAELYIRSGNRRKAKTIADRVLSIDPENNQVQRLMNLLQ